MKKIIKQFSLLLAMALSTGMNSQTTWYFGNGGGIKFTAGVTSPSAPPGTTMSGAAAAWEGSAVLVDASNNVIMYSNGSTIWNGVGTAQGSPAYELSGNYSSTQTALIVPIPGSSTSSSIQKAYIFTVSCSEKAYGNGTNSMGLRVSLATITGIAPNCTITITDPNRNVLLTPIDVNVGEKLSVTNFVIDNTGKGGYWILVHGIGAYTKTPGDPTCQGVVTHTNVSQAGENVFYAYHVTCSTTSISLLDATEKLSSFMPAVVSQHRSWNHPSYNDQTLIGAAQLNGQGQMKFSSDAKKVACTLPYFGNVETSSGWTVNPVCQLYDFDANTGSVGGAHAVEFSLGFNHTNSTLKDGDAYGIEFSPNGNYLYASSTCGSGRFYSTAADGITTRIYRYNISTWTPSAGSIVTSYLDVNNNLGSYAAMQMGPNNKIYVAKQGSTSLSVINDPDNPVVGSCGFVANSVPIAGQCMSGLPTTVLVARTPSVPIIQGVSNCSGSNIYAIGSTTGEPASAYYWEIYASDGAGNPVNAAGAISSPAWFVYNVWNTGTSPGVFTFPGTSTLPCNKYYTVKLALTNGCGSWVETTRTFLLYCTPTPVSTNNTICYGSSTTLCAGYTPSTGHDAINVAWITPSAVSPNCITVSPTTTTSYPVWVTQNGCTGTATSTVTVLPHYTDFGLASVIASTLSTYYTATATPIIDPVAAHAADPSFGFIWVVSEIDPVTGLVINNTTVTNPECWWALPLGVNNFIGYNGVTPPLYATNNTGTAFNGTAFAPISTIIGHFQSGHTYRVTYGTWSNTCPGSTVTATMYKCAGCKSGNGSDVIIEYGDVVYNDPLLIGLQNPNPVHEEEISIFPNPSNGQFTINLSGDNTKDIVVYDVMGNIVFEKNSTADQNITLDLTDKANGIYFVKVVNGSEVVLKKIIKK